MPEEEKKPELKTEPPAPETPTLPTRRARRKHSFNLSPDKKTELVKHILETHRKERDNRSTLIAKRQERRAKLMGWLPAKDYPWTGSANFWIPIMLIADLKMKATLENALKSIRPMMESRARQRRNKSKQPTIDNMLDFQFYLENAGEKIIQDAVSNFVEDEAVYLFAQWVKESQTIHDVRVMQGLDPEIDHIPQILLALKDMYGEELISSAMKDEEGWVWEITFTDDNKEQRSARIEFWETDDGKLEAHISMRAVTHDGPCIHVEEFEDIVFPVRSANLQPPSSSNPRGAPWVDKIFTINLDTIKRRMKDGTYDQLTDQDLEKISPSKTDAGSGSQTDETKQQKDEHEGTEVTVAGDREDRQGIMRFGRFDVNGDGLDEDVITWLLEDSEVLLKVALLTEIYPGIPKRPFAHDSFIPIANRVLGMSQSMLLEAFQDMMQIMIDQHIDAGTIMNIPFFTYRAASGMKAEPIYLEPGVGIALDDPQRDINFPQFPQRDSTFAINMITLLQQFVERLQMFSDVSVGRVPTGKATALRTMGTTMSLLSQADVRPEQVLRRLFSVFAETFSTIHRLNKRYLPDQKEIRVVGKSAEGEDAYLTVNRSKDIDADVDFEFKATMLNTNKQILSTNLDQIIGLMITPLAFQAGLITIDQMYEVFRDKTKALDLDPDKYWTRPPQIMQGPKLLAEEVISIILTNETLVGQPMEGLEEHLQKLIAYMSSDEFGFMNSTQVMILKDWIMKVQAVINQQQMMIGALQQFQDQQGSENGGPGGVPSTFSSPEIGDNPQINSNEHIEESNNGAAQ